MNTILSPLRTLSLPHTAFLPLPLPALGGPPAAGLWLRNVQLSSFAIPLALLGVWLKDGQAYSYTHSYSDTYTDGVWLQDCQAEGWSQGEPYMAVIEVTEWGMGGWGGWGSGSGGGAR